MLFLYVIYIISFITIYVLGADVLYKTLYLVNLEPNIYVKPYLGIGLIVRD